MAQFLSMLRTFAKSQAAVNELAHACPDHSLILRLQTRSEEFGQTSNTTWRNMAQARPSSIRGANRRVAVKAVEQSWEALRFEQANAVMQREKVRAVSKQIKAVGLQVDGGLPATLLVEAVKQDTQ